jgi:predicted ATPase
MDAIPTGTVSFLFTDIEGSTRLLSELGSDSYGRLLAEHHRVCREAWVAHGGVEVDTAGDAFFVAFATTSRALKAAAAAQASLGGLGLRVRMGVHTGEVSVGETGYVGVEVHRAARIAAMAHGGQVVVSAAAAALSDEPLTALGEHRLKDLSGRERLFQLGDHAFPPLRSHYRSNLPTPATSFIGRERELADLVTLLGQDGVRLVTLTGPGGTGKTRLALQAAAAAADTFPDGVWWVPLAALADASLVLPAIEQTLDIADALLDRLRERRLLVVLDNAEHLLPQLEEDILRLQEAPDVVLLVTSRERLRLQAERVWPVAPLQPHDGAALFEARARTVEPATAPADAVVDELCERLDNLPLAIELAAARSSVFTPAQLLERIGQRLDLLKGAHDLDARQRTLRATIAWSIDLLSEPERELAYRLSVFTGGSTYEQAEAICGADPDALQALVDKSLVRRRDTELGSRYWMLETIRQFAREQLERSGEEPELLRRHAGAFLDLAVAAQPHLRSEAQEEWLARIDADIGNVRAALAWLGGAGEVERRLTMAVALCDYWIARGHLAEGGYELVEGVRNAEQVAPALRAEALSWASHSAYRRGDYEVAEELGDEGLASARRAGDPVILGQALSNLAGIVAARGDRERGRALYEASLETARAAHDTVRVARATHNLGDLAASTGDLAGARELCLQSLDLFRDLQDPTGEVASLLVVAIAEVGLGQLRDAAAYVTVALGLSQRLRDRYTLSLAIELSGAISAAQADARQAARLLGGAERLRDESGSALEPSEKAVHERSVAAIESQLDDRETSAAWAEGAAIADDVLAAEACAVLELLCEPSTPEVFR